MTREEKGKRMEELARKYAETHDHVLIREVKRDSESIVLFSLAVRIAGSPEYPRLCRFLHIIFSH